MSVELKYPHGPVVVLFAKETISKRINRLFLIRHESVQRIVHEFLVRGLH